MTSATPRFRRIMLRLALLSAPLAAGLLACAMLLLALARPAWAAPLTKLTYPGCGASLQACIDGANVGATITILPGTHSASITLNRPISLTGDSTATVILQALPGQRVLTVTGPAVNSSVVISGLTFTGGDAISGGGILVEQSASPLFVSIVLTNNSAYDGGGLYAEAGSPMVMVNSSVLSNTCTQIGCRGGGVYAGDSLTLTGTQFISNTSYRDGGGAHAQGAARLNGGLFRGNACIQIGCLGGGLHAVDSLTLSGTQFINNKSEYDGSGAYAGGAATLSGGLFRDNTCSVLVGFFGGCRGGGVYAGDSLTLTGTQFISNAAGSGGGGAYALGATTITGGLFQDNMCLDSSCLGGGLYVTASLAMSGTHFISNTSNLHGGGLYANASLALTGTHFISNTSRLDGGGVYVNGAASAAGGLFQANGCSQLNCRGGGLISLGPLALTGTQFISNTSRDHGGGVFALAAVMLDGGLFHANTCNQDGCWGGGLYAAGGLAVHASRFGANRAASGGGLAHITGSAQIINSLFAGNTARDGQGAGMRLASPGSVSLVYNTIASATVAGGSAVHVVSGTVTAVNNLVANAATGYEREGGTVNENYTLFSTVTFLRAGGIAAGPDSISGLAGFLNPAGGDFRLGPGSAAIDTGIDFGIGVDYFGAARPAGNGFDIGFHEYSLMMLFLPLVVR